MPWHALRSLVALEAYGSHVSNAFDQRVLNCVLADYLCEPIIKDGYQFPGQDAVPESARACGYILGKQVQKQDLDDAQQKQLNFGCSLLTVNCSLQPPPLYSV